MKEKAEEKGKHEEISPLKTVGPEHMDQVYNHIHHAGYFFMLEEERTRIAAAHGVDLKELAEKGELFFPVRNIDGVEYKGEIVAGDLVRIKSTVQTEGARIIFDQRMEKENGMLAMRAKISCVMVGNNGKPQRIPEWIKNKLSLQ